ncbi:Uncharacterised protein [Legionella beliardensis]|uniref:Uncharacterized protein n=1 Tax=Legionella beliardensis TaxID=91822 RepID=A0A378I1G9_9GAMM|nr:hypothetical protein [Legionella beliardensis]STX28833.1 Uncharacterised protein [Legionella beliardensis]
MDYLTKKRSFPKKNNLNSKKAIEKKVDETLKETFPASDAPSWYGGKDRKK